MKYRTAAYKIYFHSWSRKSYAIFAALGKEVCISVLALHMCKNVLLKTARKGIVVRDTQTAERAKREIEEKREKEKYGCCSMVKGTRMSLPFSKKIIKVIPGGYTVEEGISLFIYPVCI